MSTDPDTITAYPAGTWKADPAHTEIAFSARQLLVGRTRGRFTAYEITVVTDEDPLASEVVAVVDAASIDTGNRRRDAHLRSADFLDVERFPTMTFRSTGVRRTGGGLGVDGELTLHGATRQVPLAVEVGELGGQRAGFSATARIDRRDFGIATAFAMARGGVVVGYEVSISLRVRAVRQG